MRTRSYFLAAVVSLSFFAASIQPAQAFVPVLVSAVARTAAYATAETVAIDLIARGFAATDPYVRTTATMSRKTFAARLAALRGSRWAGAGKLALAIGVALGLDVLFDPEAGFYQNIPYDMNVRGSCDFGWGGESTLQGCLNNWKEYGVTSVSRFAQSGSNTVFYFRHTDGHEEVHFTIYGANPVPVKNPLTEEQIDSVLPELFANPSLTMGDYLEGLSEPELAKLFDGAEIPYNPTSPTPQLEKWKNDYRQGLLQTTDPAADHYVTPEQLQQVKDLVAAEDFAKTDDGAIAALNEKIKQPITQAQYEETNKKYSEGIDAVTAALGASGESDYSDMDQHFEELDGIITDLPNTSLPASAHMTVPQYVDCKQIHLSDGNGHELDFPSPSQCAKIETFKQGFGYFLAISVVFLLSMQLLTRPHG